MPQIYLILMHSGSGPSNLVKLFTAHKYSHVAISLNIDCSTLYSFGRKTPNNFLNGGFVAERRDGGFFKKFPKTYCAIYSLEISPEKENALKNIIADFVKEKEKYKYDFLGIIPRFFKIPVLFKNRFVCSTFVAYALEKSGIWEFENGYKFARPRDFENIKGLNLVFRGNYLDYQGVEK